MEMLLPLQSQTFTEVPGLRYYPRFLTQEQQGALLKFISQQAETCWEPDFKRRKLCFGYKYDYVKRTIAMALGPLPTILESVALRLVRSGVTTSLADQAIVAEYKPGQGISAHVDANCFGPEIVSVSLASVCSMNFRANRNSSVLLNVLLDPGSALLIAGPARDKFTHEIPGRLRDVTGGQTYIRSTRFSITFRTVIPSVR